MAGVLSRHVDTFRNRCPCRNKRCVLSLARVFTGHNKGTKQESCKSSHDSSSPLLKIPRPQMHIPTLRIQMQPIIITFHRPLILIACGISGSPVLRSSRVPEWIDISGSHRDDNLYSFILPNMAEGTQDKPFYDFTCYLRFDMGSC